MKVEIIVHNINGDICIIANSKSNELERKDNKLYVNIKHGHFIKGRELIEELETEDQCKKVYKYILDFMKKRKEIKEVIQLTLKDIKNSKTQEERDIFEKFLWNRESEFLKYDNLYIKDIV